MPGHKADGEFAEKFPVAPMDVTELSYSDNLHCPKDVIAAAQRDIAEILGARKSYITTDGSSSGVFAMLYCAAKYGKKVALMRTSHQSVWNACALFGLEPLILPGAEREGVYLPPEPGQLEKLISADDEISAALITSPDYYGNVAPLEEYSEILRRHNRLLLVDEAHGAHLAFGDAKLYAGAYADMWVDGAHKTLPTLTQGAVVCVNDSRLVPCAEEALGIFRTTSPSYPVMASVEYGVKYVANHREKYAAVLEEVGRFGDGFPLPVRPTDDKFKLAVDFKPLSVSADKVAEILESKGVYAEFSDGRYILFYLSPLTGTGELEKLKKRLLAAVGDRNLKGTYAARENFLGTERTYGYLYALGKPHERVDLDKSAGRICAANAGVTPPCFPVTVAGEIITPAAIKILTKANNTFGITGGKICVVKK